MGIDLILGSQDEKSDNEAIQLIDLGRSLKFTSLHSALHFIEITSTHQISIALDGINWNELLANSEKAGAVKTSTENPNLKTLDT
jgi:hypothetical protein